MKILLVDDDRTMRRIASLSLTRKGGHEVICASSGAEAASMAEACLPDLIILDLVMPGMDGLEVCRRFQAVSKTRGVAVIFLSAKAEPDDIRRFMEAGAVGWIKKPFDPLSLSDEVNDILSKAGREDA